MCDVEVLLQQQNLQYHDHVRREQRQPGGGTRAVWMATARPMTPGDVLSTRQEGDAVILVTADGQKWRVRPGGPAENLMEV